MNNVNAKVLEENTVICRQGDQESDLYYVESGELLICSRSGKMVTPLATVGAGEYFGELAFFDQLPRSADVITTKQTCLIQIPSSELKKQFPNWLLITARQLSQKIRLQDQVIAQNGIKRTNVESVKPLSIDEQRKLLQVLENN